MTGLSLKQQGKRLRIYISERDRWHGGSLDTAILELMREQGIAGATEFRGIQGFGTNARIHTIRQEVSAMDLPVVIEAVDAPEKIDSLLELVYPMVQEGLITTEAVEIVRHSHRSINPLPAGKPVSEVMTREVVSLMPDMTVQDAWLTMLKKQVKAAPVTDADGRVIGLLTNEDLLESAGIQQRLSIALRMDAAEIKEELHHLQSTPLKVGDVMTRPAVTARADETLGEVTTRMVSHGLKRMPVVDSAGKLAGVISRLDILRQVAQVHGEIPVQRLPAGVVKTVADIMSHRIPMVNQDDDLETIIEKFSQCDSYRLIVVDSGGKAIGLISDSDVVARVQPARRRGVLAALRNIGKPPAGRETAFDLMSPGPLTAAPDTPVLEALQRMLAESRKWLVVVNDEGQPLGLVDRQLMLESLAAGAETA